MWAASAGSALRVGELKPSTPVRLIGAAVSSPPKSGHIGSFGMSELKNCVLIVEDEPLIAETMSFFVEDLGLAVCGIPVNS